MAMKARRRADRLSILDISIEDDCLLPGTNNKGSSPPRQPDESKIPSPNVEEPARLASKNKNKGHHSLRKSLAWDKAFLTGEGVLDPDELPVRTRSPKKLPDLPTFELNTKRPTLYKGQAFKDNSAINLRSFSERFDSLSARLEEARNLPPVSSYSGPRMLAPKKVIESAIQKGTRLRLPSTITADERKRTAEQPAKPPNGSSITRRVTSVSRKVKDTLEKVLPGRVEAGGCRGSKFGESRILETDADSELSSSEGSCNSEGRFYRSYSAGSRMRCISVESKPTGLRIPSPKLGFFDPGRTSESVKPSIRTAVRIPTGQQSSKGKPHGLPRGKPGHIRSGIPSGPHVRTTERESSGACTSAWRISNELFSPGAHSAASSGSLEEVSHKLEVETAESCDITKSEVNGEVHKSSCDGGVSKLADENNTSIWKAVPVQMDRSPLAVNASLLNSGSTSTRDKGSFFAFAKKAVGRLSSPLDKGTSTQENWEAATKVEKLVKTGPVQHSPPNKPVPQPGPWSPVRRNMTQLGPFDCTKSNAQGAGWED